MDQFRADWTAADVELSLDGVMRSSSLAFEVVKALGLHSMFPENYSPLANIVPSGYFELIRPQEDASVRISRRPDARRMAHN